MNKDTSNSRLFVVSWNTTKMCNLRCKHCYLDATYLDGTVKDELSTEEGLRLIDDIHSINPNTVLILTGGEPLLRKDIYLLGRHAAEKGLMPVLGTNGSLLNDDVAKKLIENSILGVGVSIDSLNPEIHDEFRGVSGSLKMTIDGLKAVLRHNMQFQVQTTVTRRNFDEIPDIIEFCYNMGCKVFNLFFLVCTGRGQDLSDISPAQYEDMLSKLVDIEQEYRGKMIIKAKCAPHFKRLAYQKNPDSSILKGYTSDCLAGVHYCRVTSEGDVTTCPYMPLPVGNVLKTGFVSIWKDAEVFRQLRDTKLKGKCGECEFRTICGGCRARSYASSNDYLLDDPWCEYDPPKDGRPLVTVDSDDDYWKDEKYGLNWSDEAIDRLNKIPKFVKNMIVKSVERYAFEKGYTLITPKVMKESRENSGASHRMPGGMAGMMKGMSGLMSSFVSKKTTSDD